MQTLVVLACVVLVLMPGAMVTALASWPRGLLVSALVPVSQVLGRTGLLDSEGMDTVDGGGRAPLGEGPALDYLRALEDENRRLRGLVDQLAESRELLARPSARLVLAPVLAVYQGGSGLSVRAGETSGVRLEDPVVVGSHLIGRVSGVAPLTCDMDAIARPGVRLEVRVVPATVTAPTREALAWVDYDEKAGGFVAELALDVPVEQGDVAHLVDERWPLLARGRIVGRVAIVDDRTSKPLLLKRVVIEPVYRATDLRRVTVVVERATAGGGG
ncbi:MAG: rod shape-determining protein MreC [Phycisphaeraceae bacterium]